MPTPLPPSPFRIETERFVIRPWEPAEEPAFRAMVGDPEMMRYISSGQPWNEERIEEFFTRQRRHLATRGFCLGAVVEKTTGRIVGLSGLQPLRVGDDVEAGWWVAKELWGQGVGTEVGRACLRYAWDVLDLPRMVAVAFRENGPSIRIMEKIGMSFERNVLGKDIGFPGGEIELVIYAIAR
jgi:ribosomal-protein-alanine N-acetyltransferase